MVMVMIMAGDDDVQIVKCAGTRKLNYTVDLQSLFMIIFMFTYDHF